MTGIIGSIEANQEGIETLDFDKRTEFLFIFDNGSTLIDDPFQDTLARVEQLVSDCHLANLGLSREALPEIIEAWDRENYGYSFPLASHFLQEEVWVLRALLSLSAQGRIEPGIIPRLSPLLLHSYRNAVIDSIKEQRDYTVVRKCLEFVRSRGAVTGVASNDREFATRAMLSWVDLLDHFDWVFTSEGMSLASQKQIEKPSNEFFTELERIAFPSKHAATKRVKVYIGDSEENDVIAPQRLGYITVRVFNERNNPNAIWLDDPKDTKADYYIYEHGDLMDVITKIYTDHS